MAKASQTGASSDPYHELLGIPPAEQPPTHYRLLGLSPFESNATVIERAADRQMKHLRDFKSGQHSTASQKLLNEIVKARRALLSDDERAAYDEQLRAKLAPQQVAQPLPSAPVPIPTPAPTPLVFVQRRETAKPAPLRSARTPAGRSPVSDHAIPLSIAGVALVGLLAAGLFLWSPWSSPPAVAQKPRAKPPAQKRAPVSREREATPPITAPPAPFVPPQPIEPPRTAVVPTARPVVSEGGLRGYWPLDDASGDTTADGSGNDSTGALTGGVQRAPGERAGAFVFDGEDDSVGLGRPAALEITGQITLAAWIRQEATDGIRNIVAQGHTTNPNGEIFLRIQDGNYYVGYWDGFTYTATAPIPTEDFEEWVHLAGSFDGTAWKLYRNGELLATTDGGTGVTPVNSAWTIGAGVNGTERFFRGAIDDVRIYDRALAAEMIQGLAAPNDK